MLDTQTKIIRSCYFPMMVSKYTGRDDSSEEILERWEKFDLLSEDNKDLLISEHIAITIRKLCLNFSLSIESSRKISRAIRSFYFGEIQLQDFPQILSKEMNVDFATAQKISEVIIQKIINDDSQEKAYQAQLEKLPFSSAIQKFPPLGEQLLTSAKIKLKNFPEPVRPSINNWLSDYTFSLGYESHSAMDRGTYLFRNENARLLNSMDREKLSYLLKAYDENSPVDININTSQIIFPRHETRNSEQGTVNNIQRTINNEQRARINDQRTIINEQRTTSNNNSVLSQPKSPFQEIYNAKPQATQPKDIFEEERTATQKRNTANLSFSSPQKFPYEKQTIQQQKTPQGPEPLHISSQKLRHDPVPPGNVVNLKN